MKYKAIELAIETEDFYMKINDFEFDFEIKINMDIFFTSYDLNKPLSKAVCNGLLRIYNSNISFKKDKIKATIKCLCVSENKKAKKEYIELINIDLFKKYNTEIFDIHGSTDENLIIRSL